MQLRQLGRSDLRIAPFGARRQCVRLERGREDVVRHSRRLRRCRFQRHRHRQLLFALGAGAPRRQVGNHHRQLAQTQRQARQGRDCHQVRRGHGRRPQPEKGLCDPRRRGFAQAPANRPHRSLPDAFRRRNDAGQRDHAGLRATDRAGQSARGRRVQSVAAAAAGVAGGKQEARPAALRVPCSRFTICRTARSSRPNTRRSCARKKSASSIIMRSPPAF